MPDTSPSTETASATGGPSLSRRQVLAGGVAVALGGSLWRAGFSSPVEAAVGAGPGPYGPLRAPDGNGVALPEGFSSRILARTGQGVGPSGYAWHGAPDGGACFAAGAGGWIYVSNSELPTGGGASMIRFDSSGRITDARRILGGTRANCAGGATPWGTWLSCEESFRGLVYECDPAGRRAARVRPGMGRFVHEAAAVDPVRRLVYLTEDEPDGCFYRFRPATWGDLSQGRLQVLCRLSGALAWRDVPDPSAASRPTRYQVSGALRFNGGEGCWYAQGSAYFTTKGDGKVWQYLASSSPARLGVFYDAAGTNAPLTGVDNLTGDRVGDLFVAEDGGNMQICVLSPDRGVAAFLQLAGHAGSEITGPAFSPDGTRLYFSSQRGSTGRSSGGVTFEVRGPFRQQR